MPSRIQLAALMVLLASPSWSAGQALEDARRLAGGGAAVYDGGCSGGSCGAQAAPCEGEACVINRAADGALRTGSLVVRPGREPRPALISEVPDPNLEADPKKPGLFKRLGKALIFGLGAGAGARAGFLAGGPVGAVIGGLIGGLVGLFMAKRIK